MFVQCLIGTKHFLEPITRPRIKKHVPESKNDLGKYFDSWMCFWFLGLVFYLFEAFLDSRIKVFWILGISGLDSGACFGSWKVFLDSGRVLDSRSVFGFWEAFWILRRVFWILGRVCRL